jgi:hypothetical protein
LGYGLYVLPVITWELIYRYSIVMFTVIGTIQVAGSQVAPKAVAFLLQNIT